MILAGLNILLLISAIITAWITYGAPPGILAIPCGIIGGIVIYGRYSAWKMGITQHAFELAGEDKNLMNSIKNREALLWATGIINVIIFIWYWL